MISVNNLTKSYGARNLFKDISLTINYGEKIGLVGPNGAGKSTFFSILLGLSESSGGTVQINKGVRAAYLPQESDFSSDATVLAEILRGDDEIQSLVKEKEHLELNNLAGTHRYGEVLHILECLRYFDIEHKAKKILFGLGFKERDFDRNVNTLSGGWKMRVLLAKLLVCSYDILFLDEPTNHLDLNAALWFKDYLMTFNGTFIMISHDRDYLNDVTNYTLILDNAEIKKIKGNYTDYEQLCEQKRNLLLKQFNEQEKKRKQLTGFIQRFHGQPNKASQARAKKKQLERMEDIIVPQDRKNSIRTFKFPQGRQSGHNVIRLKSISKSYGDICVYKDFDFEIDKGEKAVLVGENGAGKSTLLKILAGQISINGGERKLGYNVDIGYFSQTRMDVLTGHNTVFEEVYNSANGKLMPEQIRTLLGAFLFSGDDIDKKVDILSGGEKSRLILAKLLADPPNFLLLDEPTTHLDVDAVEALIKALKDYEGTLVLISHDSYFVRSVANCVFSVKDGVVVKYPGRFDYYLERIKNAALEKPAVKKTVNEIKDTHGKFSNKKHQG
ncbi:MAG: ABC-F family ATP-binding cassette domain-containing protein, partial [Candidatus Omnitrophica bacterium]|nr:ABC-F family ATP-binding cassette domain-containing protein [Candidatus Omnitrophota bacterium]